MQIKDQFLMCRFMFYFYVAENHLFQNKSNKMLNRIVTPYLKFLREIYCIFLYNVPNHIRQQHRGNTTVK